MKQLLRVFTLILFCSSGMALGQTAVSGTVTDNAGVPLPGASVLIVDTNIGTTTDFDGNFLLESEQPTPWTLEIRYTGFSPQRIEITGSKQGVTIQLQEDALGLDEVVISASRKAEKITEAPSSISIINPREISSQIEANPSSLLKKTQGVQLVQLGADRFSIALRGQSATFLSGTFVMLDNRPLSSLSEQTYFFLDNPFSKLDIDRVEVIRGPGSALYGGGVTAGVVHYLSKSPFRHPGTSVEFATGNRNTYQVSARHAGVSESNKLGYKINAFYKRGDEWQYDPNDELDRPLLSNIRPRSIDPDGETIFELEERTTADGFTYFAPQDYVEYYGVNGSLEYRPTDKTSITGTLGYSKSDASFWTTNGFGIRRPDNYFGQLKISSGNTFFSTSYSTQTQTFDENNIETLINVGPPPVGSSATAQDKRNFDAQLQQQIPFSDEFSLVAGADVRIGNTDSAGSLFARFEDDNDIEIYGGYAQAEYDVSEKFSLTGALRYDYFAPLEEGAISPRLAAVYKPTEEHTFRGSYNQAFAGPGSIQLYIDLGPLGPVNQGGGADGPPIGFQRNVGSTNPLTFDNSPITFAGTANALGESGIDRLISHQSAIDAIIAANPDLAGPLGGINTANTSTPRTVALNNGGAIIGEAAVINNRAFELTNQSTYEVGYTGFFGDNFKVALDIYYNDIENAASISTPFTRGVTSGGLANEVMATINGSTNLTAEEEADVMAALLAIFPDSDESIIGAVQSDQIRASVASGEISAAPVPDGIWVERNFFSASNVEYWGWDLNMTYYLTNDWNLSFNYSGLNETEFVDEETGIPFNLNTPKTRIGLSTSYVPVNGFNANANLRYQDAFSVINGFYSGDVDAYTLLDLGAGYNFKGGISLGVSLTNVTGVDFRPLPNLPAIGTQFLARLRYDF